MKPRRSSHSVHDTADISTQEMRDAMLRSGYLLESRLETVLVDRGWDVKTNRPYVDPVTLKSREYDLFAFRVFPVGTARLDVVLLCLVVECMNNPQPVAFISKSNASRPVPEDALRLLSTERGSTDPETGRWNPPPKPFTFGENHHYLRGRVATQYCSFTHKKGRDGRGSEWLAQHENEQHEVFLRLSAALDYETNESRTRILRADTSPSVHIYYPVLVLQGKLVEARPSRRSVQTRSVSHTQFIRVAAEEHRETAYQIDVVTERYFSRYLDTIEAEVSSAVLRVRAK